MWRESCSDYHGYADDQQTYGSCKPTATETQALRTRATECIAELSGWMKSNRLQLNSNKTEFLWCSSRRRQHQIDQSAFTVNHDQVNPSVSVRNLGVILSSDLSMTEHVTHVVCTCFAVLRQLRQVQRFLTPTIFVSLITQLILSRIDYCNIVYTGLPALHLNRLQSVIKAAARLITSSSRYSSVIPLLYDLHWLRVPERIEYKLCLLVYKCIHGTAPLYLSDKIQLVASEPLRRKLRSLHH